MSVIKVNNITNKSGTSGPVIAGIATVSSSSHFVVPVGDTRTRLVSDYDDIVTDGLVLHLDAGRVESYGGDGTTWRDLSGNGNNGTLFNGVGFTVDDGGALIFDGVDDYIQFSTVSVQTVCFWGRMDADILSLAALVATSAGGDGSLRTAPAGTFISSPDANDFHIGYVSSLMINGVSNLSSGGGNGLTIPGGRTLYQDFYVGAIGNARNISTISHTFQGRVFKGRVYAVCLYNRQLTNNELLQNYNALEGRYN